MSTLNAKLDVKGPVFKPVGQMSHQEIFNRVAYHLARQGVQSLTPSGTSCAYRGEAGRRCAVGIFIPDALYDADFEGYGPTSTSVAHVLSIDGDSPKAKFLRLMQMAHDNVTPERDFRTSLENCLKIWAKTEGKNDPIATEILDLVF
jgi:hypothetical protein